MINLFNAPFILDLTVTAVLFALCFVVVVGIKAIIYSFIELNKRRRLSEVETLSFAPRKKRKKKKILVQKRAERSIEINPDEIDKIYVKKIS